MDTILKNRLNKKSLATVIASPLVAGLLLASGTMSNQANAAEISSVGQPSLSDWLSNKSKAHKYHIKKVAFSIGTSAIYSHANLLPKTEHFAQPTVATLAIYGDGAAVCTISGLGHRSVCGAHL